LQKAPHFAFSAVSRMPHLHAASASLHAVPSAMPRFDAAKAASEVPAHSVFADTCLTRVSPVSETVHDPTADAAAARRAEIKTRTSSEVKRKAAEVYARWGLSLYDAINTFLIKSIEVGGLPFDLRPEAPSFDAIAAKAYKPKLDAEGIAVRPAEWDDGDE
jgi:DNA-damage-inducible protein J